MSNDFFDRRFYWKAGERWRRTATGGSKTVTFSYRSRTSRGRASETTGNFGPVLCVGGCYYYPSAADTDVQAHTGVGRQAFLIVYIRLRVHCPWIRNSDDLANLKLAPPLKVSRMAVKRNSMPSVYIEAQNYIYVKFNGYQHSVTRMFNVTSRRPGTGNYVYTTRDRRMRQKKKNNERFSVNSTRFGQYQKWIVSFFVCFYFTRFWCELYLLKFYNHGWFAIMSCDSIVVCS